MSVSPSTLPPCAHYGTLYHMLSFKQDRNEMIVECTHEPSEKKSILPLSLDIVTISLELSNTPKKRLKYFLKNSFVPIVEENQVIFQPPSLSKSSGSTFLLPIINKMLNMIKIKTTTCPIPTPGLVSGTSIAYDEKKAQRSIKFAKECMEDSDYEDSLKHYQNALLYTNKSEDYVFLPLFLETQGKPLEAAYSFLCLSILQFNENSLDSAKKSLDKALSLLPGEDVLPDVQADYYYATGDRAKALSYYKSLAKQSVENQKKTEAITFYEKALLCSPDIVDLYTDLAALYENKRLVIHLFLSAISHFGQKDKVRAREFYQKALDIDSNEPKILLIYLTTLNKKECSEEVYTLYRKLATLYKERGEEKEYLFYLSQLIRSKGEKDYRAYAEALIERKQMAEAQIVYTDWTDSLIKANQWEKANVTINEAIKNTGKCLSLIKLRREISMSYQSYSSEGKKGLLELAAFSLKEGEVNEAKEIYAKVQEKYQDFKSAKLLADLCANSSSEESVHFYYIASERAFQKKKMQKIPDLFSKAIQLDPTLSTLKGDQKSVFITYNFMSTMSQEFDNVKTALRKTQEILEQTEKRNQNERDELQEELLSMKKTLEKTQITVRSIQDELQITQEDLQTTNNRVERVNKNMCEGIQNLEKGLDDLGIKLGQISNKHPLEPATHSRQPSVDIPPVKLVSNAPNLLSFGKLEWEKFFGEIGTEPPLPLNIDKILNHPCPFWLDKKVKDTHILVLIPKTVNGQPFTLKKLGELIKKPKVGEATKYRAFSNKLSAYENKEVGDSHWVLITHEPIPNSSEKSYEEQIHLLSTYNEKSESLYEMPEPIEAAASILLEYFSKGRRLYSKMATRCHERIDKINTVAVGAFTDDGIIVFHNCIDGPIYGLSCLIRFPGK